MTTYLFDTDNMGNITTATSLPEIRKKAMNNLRKLGSTSLYILSISNGHKSLIAEMHHNEKAFVWREPTKGIRAYVDAKGLLKNSTRVPIREWEKSKFRLYLSGNGSNAVNREYALSISDARKFAYILLDQGYGVSADKSNNGIFYEYSAYKTPYGHYWATREKVNVLKKDGSLGKEVPWGTQFKK